VAVFTFIRLFLVINSAYFTVIVSN